MIRIRNIFGQHLLNGYFWRLEPNVLDIRIANWIPDPVWTCDLDNSLYWFTVGSIFHYRVAYRRWRELSCTHFHWICSTFNLRYEVLTLVKTSILVFWVAVPRGVVGSHQHMQRIRSFEKSVTTWSPHGIATHKTTIDILTLGFRYETVLVNR
jgi:hypothetical protein